MTQRLEELYSSCILEDQRVSALKHAQLDIGTRTVRQPCIYTLEYSVLSLLRMNTVTRKLRMTG